MKVTILGCGPSFGMPSLAYGFGSCDPQNPKNTRLRPSILIEINGLNVLIDAGPDVRQQLLKMGRPKIDAVIFTHNHYDHVNGVNDLVSFCDETCVLLPIFAPKIVIKELKHQLHYMMHPDENTLNFTFNEIKSGHSFKIRDIEVIPFKQRHGSELSMGYRIGNFAYSTDISSIDAPGLKTLDGISTWILGVLSHNASHGHLNLNSALTLIQKNRPKMTYLTHMGGDMDYARLCDELPPNIRPAYDGLELNNL